MILRRLELRVRRNNIRAATDNFFLDPRGLTGALIFEIENRVDPVLAFERAEAVLQAPSREDRGIPEVV